jgi:hypothetical protein
MTVEYTHQIGDTIYIIDSNDDCFYANPAPYQVCGVHIDVNRYNTRINYRINRGVLYEYIPSDRVCDTYQECKDRCKVLNR